MAFSQIPVTALISLVALSVRIADPVLPGWSKVKASGHKWEIHPIRSHSSWGRSNHRKNEVLGRKVFQPMQRLN